MCQAAWTPVVGPARWSGRRRRRAAPPVRTSARANAPVPSRDALAGPAPETSCSSTCQCTGVPPPTVSAERALASPWCSTGASAKRWASTPPPRWRHLVRRRLRHALPAGREGATRRPGIEGRRRHRCPSVRASASLNHPASVPCSGPLPMGLERDTAIPYRRIRCSSGTRRSEKPTSSSTVSTSWMPWSVCRPISNRTDRQAT